MDEVRCEIARNALAKGNVLTVLACGIGDDSVIAAIVAEFRSVSARTPISPLIVLANCGDDTTAAHVVTGDTSSSDRERIYCAGGCVSVTSRVLLSDLLSRRLDPMLVNLLILGRAHEVTDTCTEAFISRVWREGNPKSPFVAVTEKPHRITSLGALVKSLQLSDILLIPRFHHWFASNPFFTTERAIHQHELAPSPSVMEIQSLLVSIVESSLVEIRRSARVDVPDALSLIPSHTGHDSYSALRRKLEPVWMKLSFNCRQIVSDLAVIRRILNALGKYSAPTFLHLLAEENTVGGKNSVWWFTEDARMVQQIAKQRRDIPVVWSEIEAILSGPVDVAQKRRRVDEVTRKVLIVAADELQAKEIERFVNEGAERAMLELVKMSSFGRSGAVQEEIDSLPVVGGLTEGGRWQIRVTFLDDSFPSELPSFEPAVVILTEPSLVAVRVLEFSSHQPEVIHVLSSGKLVAEPKFGTLIDRENKAFDQLINQKRMVSSHTRAELFEEKKRRDNVQSAAGSSRQGGSRRMVKVSALLKQSILVDTRELRSALPFVLYKKGIEVVPHTLSIGDYVLSRDIAVERKSVTGTDLQQSLVSGRLYKQLVNMTHAFAWPMLLLEFSTGRTFQLQSSDAVTGEINPRSLIAQIIALIIHFPTLRLIWSPSFAFTGNVFARLKTGREQPRLDPGKAVEDSNAPPAVKRAIEFLKACPGVTAANLPAILKRVRSVQELMELTELELMTCMGKRDGSVFYRFINYEFS